MESFFVDYLIPFTYLLMGLAAFGALVFGTVLTAINNPKALVKPLIAVVIVAVIYFIASSIGSGPITPAMEEDGLSQSTVDFVSGAIITTYILAGIAIVGIVVNWFKGLFV